MFTIILRKWCCQDDTSSTQTSLSHLTQRVQIVVIPREKYSDSFLGNNTRNMFSLFLALVVVVHQGIWKASQIQPLG